MKKIYKLCTGLASATLCLAPLTYAQQDEKQSEAAHAVITDSQNREEPPYEMGTITVTATRQEEKVLDTPAVISVITREQIEDHNINNIQELVRYQPGVSVHRQASGTTPFGGLGGFTIRGVGGNRVQIVVDGARVIEANDAGNRDFVDMSTLKAVEIQRGPASVLWGADALGGMVSYQTLDPDDLLKGNQIGGKASYGFDGSNYAHSQNAMVAAQINPVAQIMFGYTHRTYHEARLRNARSDGGKWGCNRNSLGCDRFNPTDAEVNNALTKLVLRPNADHQFKLTGEFFESDTSIEQLYNKGILPSAMGMSSTDNGDRFRNQRQTRLRIALEHDWDVNTAALDNVIWRLSYSPQKRSLSDRRWYRNTRTNQNFHVSGNTDYSQNFYQADIQFTSSFDLDATKHKLTYGFQGDKTDTDYYNKSVTDNLTLGTSTTTIGGGSNFANAETIRADLYLQDEIKLFNDRFKVIPGIRHAYYSLDPTPQKGYNLIEGSEPRKISETKWLPQLGTLLKLNDQYSVYARYAEGFKMPTAEQLYTSYDMGIIQLVPNPDLKPEEVKSFDIGFRGQFNKGWFSIGTFYSDYTNFILSRQQIGNEPKYTYKNVDKVKLYGIEASAEWQVARNWTLNGSAVYQYGKQTSDNSHEYVPFDGASPLSAVLGVTYEIPKYGVSTQLFGTFTHGIDRVSDNDYYKPGGYALFDGYVNWQIDKTFRLTASVLNILNRRYFDSSAATMENHPSNPATIYTNPLELHTGPGRTFAVSLSANF